MIADKTIINKALAQPKNTNQIKLNKPNKETLKEINLIKENILIIGASSGIGNDLLKISLSILSHLTRF